jgi:hypothetical protein
LIGNLYELKPDDTVERALAHIMKYKEHTDFPFPKENDTIQATGGNVMPDPPTYRMLYFVEEFYEHSGLGGLATTILFPVRATIT